MSVIANIRIPIEDFEFGELLAGNPGTTVRLERMVPMGSAFVPYVWLDNDGLSHLEELIGSDLHVTEFRVVDTVDSEALVRLEWSSDVDGLLDALVAVDAVILEGTGQPDGWEFQLRFPDHDALSAFYEGCLTKGVSIDIESVHNPGFGNVPDPTYRLTDIQRETLLVALEAGYFDVPRATNLIELAGELGVSDTAASQRIRRGISTLLLQTIADEADPRSEFPR